MMWPKSGIITLGGANRADYHVSFIANLKAKRSVLSNYCHEIPSFVGCFMSSLQCFIVSSSIPAIVWMTETAENRCFSSTARMHLPRLTDHRRRRGQSITMTWICHSTISLWRYFINRELDIGYEQSRSPADLIACSPHSRRFGYPAIILTEIMKWTWLVCLLNCVKRLIKIKTYNTCEEINVLGILPISLRMLSTT